MIRFAVNIFGGLHFLKRSRTYICKYGFFWLYVELFAEYNFCRGADHLSHREFFYVGEDLPEQSIRENKEFLLNVQKALLMSLEKRMLISAVQRERCIDELEKQNENKKKTYLRNKFKL